MKLVFIFFVLFTFFSVNAGIYKWTDESGNIHFGDKPKSANAEELNIDSAITKKPSEITSTEDGEPLTREEKRQRITDALSEDREERKKIKEEDRIKKKNKRVQCARMRDKLKSLNRASGVYNLDEDGNRVFLSQKNRNKSVNGLKKRISKNCR